VRYSPGASGGALGPNGFDAGVSGRFADERGVGFVGVELLDRAYACVTENY